MIEINVPQDIREYEPTLIGFLTTRQFCCGAAMAALVYGGYMLEKAVGIEDPINFPIFLVLAIPPFLIGWWKPYGLHFEVFVVHALKYNVQAPNVRPYVVENMWDVILKEEQENADAPPAKKERKQKTPKSSLPKELRSYK